MASADEYEILITGRGGHASMPHDAIDPIPPACEIVLALQSALSRQIPIFDPAVVTIAELHAGTAPNVIPPSVTLRGTMRAVSDATRDKVRAIIDEITGSIASAHHCQGVVTYDDNGYPVTVNAAAAAERTLAVARRTLQNRVIELPTPIMGAEDWSLVLQRIEGSMAFLGAAPPGIEHPSPNHSDTMMLDEESFSSGVAIYAAMALEP
jgi:hippurate hydrolase